MLKGEGSVQNRLTRATWLTLACALAALALAAPVSADVVVGVADNRPKTDPTNAERFFTAMSDVGLKENRIAVVWDPLEPSTISGREALHEAVARAEALGIRLTLAVYPASPRAITGRPGAPEQFTRFLQDLAREYPQVRDFIVGNEPNKNLFWQPQFNPNGSAAACAAYESLLAQAYDALKAVDQRITVMGLALGARGGDNARAAGNLSISPVRCIRDIGRAYRASRRTRPIMDELSYHAYPNSSLDTLEQGYMWPNAGIPNLARIKQAVWDAFYGTAQPIFPEAGLPYGPVRTLRLRVNEIGWQVSIPPASQWAYHGRENVNTTDEGRQAAIYGNLIPMLACDPGVRSILFFNLVDEPNLERWQSGLLRADWTRRPSYGIVKGALTAGTARCTGRAVAWRHAYKVVGAQVRFPDARRPRRAKDKTWGLRTRAEEGARYNAGVFPVTKAGVVPAAARRRIGRALRSGRRARGAALSVRGTILGGRERIVKFPAKRLKPGYYVYALTLVAEMNSARKQFYVGRAFRVGGAATAKAPKRKTPPRLR
jgi:hypothetical protein